jgi:hypothetical protein
VEGEERESCVMVRGKAESGWKSEAYFGTRPSPAWISLKFEAWPKRKYGMKEHEEMAKK